MYRLLKTVSIKRNKVYFAGSIKPCSLCNRDNIIFDRTIPLISTIPRRNITTGEFSILVRNAIKNKLKKKPKKKYAELVEVNEGKTNLTKAVIKKLTANNVSQLSERPELSLEQFHLLKSSKIKPVNISVDDKPLPKKSVQTSASEENDDFLTSINLSPINDELLKKQLEEESEWDLIQRDTEYVDMFSLNDANSVLHEELELEPEELKIPTMSKKKKRKSKSKKAENLRDFKVSGLEEPLDEKHLLKYIRFNQNLASYIELCVQCDLLNLGFGTLNRYVHIHTTKSKKVVLTSPLPFEILLHGFASKANIDKMLELLKMMVKCNIHFTPQTFTACFECCGRSKYTSDIQKILNMIKGRLDTYGWSFQHLLDQCIFSRDQRDQVMKAIRLLDSDFVWDCKSTQRNYSLPILQDLNTNDSMYFSPASGLINDKQMSEYIKEQMNIEGKSYCKIKSAVKPETISPQIQIYRREWEKMTDKWREALRDGFVKRLSALEDQVVTTRSCFSTNVFPYLRVLTPDQYVEIMMNEIYRLLLGSEHYSPMVKVLHKNLGRQVKMRYDLKVREQSGYINKFNKVYRNYCKWYLHPETNPTSYNTRHEWLSLCDKMAASGPTMDDNYEEWPMHILTEVGKFLYDTIISDTVIDVNAFKKNAKPNFQKAFYLLYRYEGHYLMEEIRPNSNLCELYRNTEPEDIIFDAKMLPMVSPPQPWTSTKNGGYLLTKVDFVRLYNGSPLNPVESVSSKNVDAVFDSLNQLSSTPWKINEPMLDVMLKVFRDGGSRRLKVPLSTAKFMEIEMSEDNMKGISYQDRFRLNRRKAETYALWVESLYRLSLANHFRNRIFWLPHNLDFRGRTYPVPPHMSHLGSDLARCLLVFGKGEKLGPRGLDWLKIHCVNLTGLKKREPIDERLQYANEILPEILDSAENPLTGKMWWTESDEMWQTLACCMEIKAALDSGDPENYICHFPVHQDGSCNGLQHYAALGRDQEGGKSVNLSPCERPQDVYTCVVELVENRRVLDAEKGLEIAQALDGIIKRKVIKQTVMTTVYGVTMFGARLQIAKQLKDTKNFPQNLVWPASLYLVNSTFECLRQMFTSTRLIQDWFVECAKYISKDKKQFVEWETPLGLPVIQPYSKVMKVPVISDVAEKGVRNGGVLGPNWIKQKNAFPPNYIHSLDSSHMMLTSLYVEREGISFVSVHDCFWTHPSTVEIMNKVCREQFIKLHSLPLLEDLSDYFMKKYAGDGSDIHSRILTKIPDKGSLKLEDVLCSTYFFS